MVFASLRRSSRVDGYLYWVSLTRINTWVCMTVVLVWLEKIYPKKFIQIQYALLVIWVLNKIIHIQSDKNMQDKNLYKISKKNLVI